jgi:DNA-directed RNA polymerase subunit RPC12/RpoP
MKKLGYCEYCDLEFDYEIKTIEDTKNVTCPKCNKKINPKSKKTIPLTKTEKTVDNVAHTIINIYYYFYLVTSILGLIFYFTKQTKLFEITTTLIIIGIVIDYLRGYTRNIFGTLGLLISIGIGIYIIKDIKTGAFLGITVCTFISSFIKQIINKIINKLFRKYG